MDNIPLRLVSDKILGVGLTEMCLHLRCQRGIGKHGMWKEGGDFWKDSEQKTTTV